MPSLEHNAPQFINTIFPKQGCAEEMDNAVMLPQAGLEKPNLQSDYRLKETFWLQSDAINPSRYFETNN